MGELALLSAVALAAVFVVSGVAKLTDPGGTREAVVGFGVPDRLAAVVAPALAPAELGVALLLLVPATRAVGLVASLALLGAFTTAVVLALRAGRRPECHCFGRIGGADVSGRTVARNLALGAIALTGLLAQTAASETRGGVAGVLGGLALAAVVVLAEAVAGRAARRAREQADERAFERDSDALLPAPDFRADTLADGEVSLADLLAPGRPLLMVFLSPGCGPCRQLRPAVSRWAEAYRDRLSVVVVASGGRERNQEAYEGQQPPLTVLLDDDDTIRPLFEIRGTPGAVLVDPDGTLRGGTASGERLVRRLLATGLAGGRHEQADSGARPAEGIDAASLTLSSIVTPRVTVTAFATDEGTVLIDEADGASISLDQIGGIVWSLLDGSSPLEEIVVDLAEAFSAPVEVVGADVLELVRSLGRAGMLEGVAPEPMSDDVETAVPHVHAP